jgi:hypothetical protein
MFLSNRGWRVWMFVTLIGLSTIGQTAPFTRASTGSWDGQNRNWSYGNNSFFSSVACIGKTIATAEWACGGSSVSNAGPSFAPPTPHQIEVQRITDEGSYRDDPWLQIGSHSY